MDPHGYHMLTCKFGGGPVWAHNRFVTGWSDCIRDVGLSCKIEPRFSYLNNENRPDIIAFGSGSGESFELDKSLAHPWASEASRRSAVEDGAAASIRKKKITKYDSNIRPSRSAAKFFPIVAEHFGHWGKHACDFFSLLVSHVERSEGKVRRNEFACFWRRRLSVLLQNCNSSALSHKLSRLSGVSSRPDLSTECEVHLHIR